MCWLLCGGDSTENVRCAGWWLRWRAEGAEERRGQAGAGDSPGSWQGSNETSTELEQSPSSKNTYAYTRVWSAKRHFTLGRDSTTPGLLVDTKVHIYELEFATTEKAAFGPGVQTNRRNSSSSLAAVRVRSCCRLPLAAKGNPEGTLNWILAECNMTKLPVGGMTA